MVPKNPRRKISGRLDVTFADQICAIAETHVRLHASLNVSRANSVMHARPLLSRSGPSECYLTMRLLFVYAIRGLGGLATVYFFSLPNTAVTQPQPRSCVKIGDVGEGCCYQASLARADNFFSE